MDFACVRSGSLAGSLAVELDRLQGANSSSKAIHWLWDQETEEKMSTLSGASLAGSTMSGWTGEGLLVCTSGFNPRRVWFKGQGEGLEAAEKGGPSLCKIFLAREGDGSPEQYSVKRRQMR